MNTMKPNSPLPARRLSAPRAVLALLAAGALTAGAVQLGSADGGDRTAKVTHIGFTSVANFSDDRRLAGFAEDIFLGRVSGAGSTADKDPLPETDFPVQVLDTIKGSAHGTVTVVQQGGRLPGRDDELRLMEGDRELEPGRTYLFATRSDPQGRRFLVAQFGDVPVRDAAHQRELREKFAEAVRSQIAFQP
jgi:hypothetical protein